MNIARNQNNQKNVGEIKRTKQNVLINHFPLINWSKYTLPAKKVYNKIFPI